MIKLAEESNEVEPVAGDSSPKLTVEFQDNHIFFYCGVDSDRCLALIKTIRDTDIRLRNETSSRMLGMNANPTPIYLHIQSYGGRLDCALAIADQLKSIQTPIYSIAEGCCASAATLISISCTKRFILKNSYMMIHQLSSSAWGKYEEIKDEVHVMDMLMDSLVSVYKERTKMKEKQIREFLSHDSWFNAQECIKHGLVDEIL